MVKNFTLIITVTGPESRTATMEKRVPYL